MRPRAQRREREAPRPSRSTPKAEARREAGAHPAGRRARDAHREPHPVRLAGAWTRRTAPYPRELALAAYAKDTTIREIAGQLQRTEGSLYQLLARIRMELHRCMTLALAGGDS